jgi:hypothetical protein
VKFKGKKDNTISKYFITCLDRFLKHFSLNSMYT